MGYSVYKKFYVLLERKLALQSLAKFYLLKVHKHRSIQQEIAALKILDPERSYITGKRADELGTVCIEIEKLVTVEYPL